MLSSLSPANREFLNQLNRISARMERAQRQISTGRKLTLASDNPDQIATLLTARAHLSAAAQIEANLGRLKAEVDTGEQALEAAVQLFERVRVLGAQGATFSQTPETRASIAQEVSAVLKQLVGAASTQVEGRYIFAGDTDQVAPYTIDLSQPAPISAYLGAAATRQAQHPNGTTFDLSLTAQEIFDSTDPATNVFGTVLALRDALLAGDDAAIAAAVEALKPAGDHLNTELAFYGTAQNNISEAVLFGQQLQLQLQTQIAGLEDADLTEAILELTSGQNAQQAALQARAQVPRGSLFDFIG